MDGNAKTVNVNVVFNAGADDDAVCIRQVSAANYADRMVDSYLQDGSALQARIRSHRHETYPLSRFWDKFDAELAQTHSRSVQSDKSPSQNVGEGRFGSGRSPKQDAQTTFQPQTFSGQRRMSEQYRKLWDDFYASEKKPEKRGAWRNVRVKLKERRQTEEAERMRMLQAEESEEEKEDIDAQLAEKLQQQLQLEERARHGWQVLRNFVLRKEKTKRKSKKRSQYRWTAVHTRLTSIARSTDSRLHLYERYLETPHVWIEGFRILPKKFIDRYKFHFDHINTPLPCELERSMPAAVTRMDSTQPQQTTRQVTKSSRGRLQGQQKVQKRNNKSSQLLTRAKTAVA